jgi:hypothetical protein
MPSSQEGCDDIQCTRVGRLVRPSLVAIVCEDVILRRELLVASKDKGGAKNKKVASKSLKEKREAKKAKGASSSGASGASR